jgi:hypothetical protein
MKFKDVERRRDLLQINEAVDASGGQKERGREREVLITQISKTNCLYSS